MSDINESTDGVEQPLGSSGRGDFLTKAAIERRTMLKGAVAAGVFAGTWVAPHIETFGFAPAAAATQCQQDNPAVNDLNRNVSGNTYVSAGYTPCTTGRGSFGNVGQVDRIQFGGGGNNGPNPPGCSKVVVRTVPTDCATTGSDLENPDITGFAVVIDNAPGQTDQSATCQCSVQKVTIYQSNGTTTFATVTLNMVNAFAGCAGSPYFTGPGIRMDATTMGTDPCNIPAGYRIRVTISCSSTGPCT